MNPTNTNTNWGIMLFYTEIQDSRFKTLYYSQRINLIKTNVISLINLTLKIHMHVER